MYIPTDYQNELWGGGVSCEYERQLGESFNIASHCLRSFLVKVVMTSAPPRHVKTY